MKPFEIDRTAGKSPLPVLLVNMKEHLVPDQSLISIVALLGRQSEKPESHRQPHLNAETARNQTFEHLQRIVSVKLKLGRLVGISLLLRVTHIHISHIHIRMLARVHVRMHVRIDIRRCRCRTW